MTPKTSKEIQKLAEELSWVKLDQSVSELERAALQSGIEALLQISNRIKKAEAA